MPRADRKLVYEIERAFDAGELAARFVPVVSLDSGYIERVEAFLCMETPGLGAPGQIVPDVAIGNTRLSRGLLGSLLKEACGFVRDCRRGLLPSLELVLPISEAQLRDTELPSLLTSALDVSGLRSGVLAVAIDEDAALADRQATAAALSDLRQAGIGALLSGFTVASSSAVTSFGFGAVQIDMRAATVNTERTEAMREAVELAQLAGLPVIASRVDTSAEYELLRTLGCTYEAVGAPLSAKVFFETYSQAA
jgi:EAL domain-containing protein (putative c-di-GMP-specific phosphodiesterase class I)